MDSFELVNSFPANDDEVLLSSPVNLSFSEDKIYISDWRPSKVHVFTYDGEFVRSIGREGRGPGEFINQNKTEYRNGKLFVEDQGNRRHAIIDLSEDTVSIEPKRDLFHEFTVSDDKIFGFISHPQNANIDSLSLIKVYDHNLNPLKNFGKYLNFTGNMNIWASYAHLEIFNEKLYAAFSSFPILRIYSLDGQLLNTINFNETANLDYTERIERNYRSETYDENGEGAKKIFESFSVNEEGFFGNVYHDYDLIIDHFDHNGNFVQRHVNKMKGNDFFVRDMKVIKDGGMLKYYVLYMIDGIPKVDVYESKINNSKQAGIQ